MLGDGQRYSVRPEQLTARAVIRPSLARASIKATSSVLPTAHFQPSSSIVRYRQVAAPFPGWQTVTICVVVLIIPHCTKPAWPNDGRDGDRHRRLQTGESAFPGISAYLARTALTGRQ